MQDAQVQQPTLHLRWLYIQLKTRLLTACILDQRQPQKRTDEWYKFYRVVTKMHIFINKILSLEAKNVSCHWKSPQE